MLSRVVVVEVTTNSGADTRDNVAARLHGLEVLVPATKWMKIGPGLGTAKSKLKLSGMRLGVAVAVAVISRGGHGDCD